LLVFAGGFYDVRARGGEWRGFLMAAVGKTPTTAGAIKKKGWP